MVDMVVINGVRYRAEDAKRLGLKPETDTKARRPQNKARAPQQDKAPRKGAEPDTENEE